MSAEPALRAALLEAGDRMPPPLVPGDLWARARRERRHRRVRRVVVAVAVAAVAVLGAPLLGVVPAIPAPASRPDHVSGYPMRIGHQWIITDLPAAPGPIAALVQTTRRDGSADQPTGWVAVSPSGRQWRVPLDGRSDIYPALSANGRFLAYPSSRTGSLVIADLVSGRLTRYADVGSGATGPSVPSSAQRPLWVQDQAPGYFSPDGSRALYLGGRRIDTSFGAVVLDRITGRVSLIPTGDRTGDFPIGWSGPDAVWWFSWRPNPADATQPRSATLRAVALDGRVMRTVNLDPHSWQRDGVDFSQWSGPVSSDGTRMAATSNNVTSPGVYRWKIDTGGPEPGDTFVEMPGLWSTCGLTWSGGRLIVPTLDPGAARVPAARTVLLDGEQQRTVSVVSPRLGPRCVVWAADALAAGPTGPHPFGVSNAGWTWWWQEILAGAVAVLLGLALVIAVRRRARRP